VARYGRAKEIPRAADSRWNGPADQGAGPAPQPPRRDRLEHYVKQLVGDSKLPLFSKRLLDILALGTQDRTSAHKLAALVMEDYALTVNVLRMANSFAYNRSNHAIENVSHAIVVLAWTPCASWRARWSTSWRSRTARRACAS
jgi:hypothetical protein